MAGGQTRAWCVPGRIINTPCALNGCAGAWHACGLMLRCLPQGSRHPPTQIKPLPVRNPSCLAARQEQLTVCSGQDTAEEADACRQASLSTDVVSGDSYSAVAKRAAAAGACDLSVYECMCARGVGVYS